MDNGLQKELEEYQIKIPHNVRKEQQSKDKLVQKELDKITEERSGLFGGKQNHVASWGELVDENAFLDGESNDENVTVSAKEDISGLKPSNVFGRNRRQDEISISWVKFKNSALLKMKNEGSWKKDNGKPFELALRKKSEKKLVQRFLRRFKPWQRSQPWQKTVYLLKPTSRL